MGREISAFEGLELYDGKLSRTVLRGQRAVRPCATRCKGNEVIDMNEKMFPGYFRYKHTPTWGCPACGSNSLTAAEEVVPQFKDPIDTTDPDFDPEWIEYIFSLNLQCSIANCAHKVVCIGAGNVSQEPSDERGGDWEWVEMFQVKYFEPPLKMFNPPENTPYWVVQALELSFSTFFSSPGTSLSNLRFALETLLDELDIPSARENGKFMPLAERIEQLPEEKREIIKPATAIRWLGNDGTHSGFRVSRADLVTGYKIFEHILAQIYPDQNASIQSLIEKINEQKGIGKNA